MLGEKKNPNPGKQKVSFFHGEKFIIYLGILSIKPRFRVRFIGPFYWKFLGLVLSTLVARARAQGLLMCRKWEGYRMTSSSHTGASPGSRQEGQARALGFRCPTI